MPRPDDDTRREYVDGRIAEFDGRLSAIELELPALRDGVLDAIRQAGEAKAAADFAAARADAAGTVASDALARTDGLMAGLTEALARIVALEGMAHEHTEPPPPPPRTVFGAAVWNHYTDWQPMLDALGLPDLASRRTYYTPGQGIPATYATGGLSVDVAAGRGSQVSFKPAPGSVARGEWDAQIVSLLASKPEGIDWRIAIGNESEAPEKGLDPADQVADLLHLCDIRDDVRPDVKVTSTHMGYSFDAGRDLDVWLPPELRARLDSVSINHYQTMTADYRTWHAIMAPTVAKVITEWGMSLVVWEWGYPEDPDNPTRKADIVVEHAAWCAEYGVEVSMHYNTAKGVVSRDPRYLQTSGPQTLDAFRVLFGVA